MSLPCGHGRPSGYAPDPGSAVPVQRRDAGGVEADCAALSRDEGVGRSR